MKTSCVKSSLIGVSRDKRTLKVIPLYCHKWQCPHCGRVKKKQWIETAQKGDPQRFITLTLRRDDSTSPGYKLEKIKKAFRKLIGKIRREIGSCEYMVVYEMTKAGTPHIHMLQRGTYIPKKWLSRVWCSLTGAYIVDIHRLKGKKEVAAYVAKYLIKSISTASEVFAGKRVVSKSKGYVLHGGSEDDKERAEKEEIDSWTYTSMTPKEVMELVCIQRGYQVTELSSDGGCTLKDGDGTDVISYILYCAGDIAQTWT